MPKKVREPEEEPALLGRGGQQHKYLQQLIKRMAEDRGYRAIIEKPVLNGAGKVDVSLEKEGLAIACEISVTSTPEQEIGNLEKCLSAGYQQIFLISSEMRILNKVRDLASDQLSEADLVKIRFLPPAEVFAHLEALEMETKSANEETVVRGYKVKTNFVPVPEHERKTRRRAVTEIVVRAIRRLKGGK